MTPRLKNPMFSVVIVLLLTHYGRAAWASSNEGGSLAQIGDSLERRNTKIGAPAHPITAPKFGDKVILHAFTQALNGGTADVIVNGSRYVAKVERRSAGLLGLGLADAPVIVGRDPHDENAWFIKVGYDVYRLALISRGKGGGSIGKNAKKEHGLSILGGSGGDGKGLGVSSPSRHFRRAALGRVHHSSTVAAVTFIAPATRSAGPHWGSPYWALSMKRSKVVVRHQN